MYLFKKKKVLIIVGAGASVEFGMPSVSDIDILFDNWSNQILKISTPNNSLYMHLKEKIEQYFKSTNNPSKTNTNFEEVLFTAMNIYSINNDNNTNPIGAFYNFNLKSMPYIKEKIDIRNVEHKDFKNLTSYLIDELLKEFRQRCLSLNTSKQTELTTLKTFLSELEKYFDIGVLTFNYDNIFLSQLNNPITGFDQTGMFNPDIILNSKDWKFIYHIHGSVHFDMQSNSDSLHNVVFKSDLATPFQQNSSGRNEQKTIESLPILTSSIIVGYGKSYQIQKNPFYLYLTDFVKKIYEADALLFAGYGFNDIYVNNIITESLNFRRNRPVVVLDYSKDEQYSMQNRFDNWSINLLKCIPTNASMMATEKYSFEQAIIDLKYNKEFEISKEPNRPLSIWHNGFLEACRNPDLIINELKR